MACDLKFKILVTSGCIVASGIPGTSSRYVRADGDDQRSPVKLFDTFEEAESAAGKYKSQADVDIVAVRAKEAEAKP